jgi:hypothetical protein
VTGWEVVSARCVAGGGHPLDDRFGVAGDFAWVIDGATDLTHDVLFAEAAGNASWLAAQLDKAFSRFAVSGMTGPELIRRAIAQVSLVASLEGVDEIEDFPVAVGVVARITASADVELTLIGDCIAAVEQRTDEEVAEVRPVTDPAWPALPATIPGPPAPPPARRSPSSANRSPDQQVGKMVAARRRYNGAGGRWVLRREPEAADHVFVSVHPSPPGSRVLLMSDGAERLLHKPGFTFVELFDRAFDDPDALIAELRDFEDKQAPDRWHVRHDDVTLLALRLPPG